MFWRVMRRVRTYCEMCAGVALSAALAGCGVGVAVPRNYDERFRAAGMLTFCMQRHGLPSFPNPGLSPGGPGFNELYFSTSGALIVDGRVLRGVQVARAVRACRALLPKDGVQP
jgi:hypothetical protein